MTKRQFTRRMVALGLAQALGFGALGARLYQLQVLDGRRYAPLADDNRTSVRLVAPVRGRILDRNGVLLAGNEQSFRVSLTPSLSGDVGQTLALLSRIVSLAPEDKEQLLARARRAGRGTAVIVARNLTFEQVAEINLLTPQLPGVEAEIEHIRRYNPSLAAGHITGYVGTFERRGIDDDVLLRIPGIRIGKAGIESAKDVELRGRAGRRRAEVDARGRIVRHLEEIRPVGGSDVVSTIDMPLQTRVTERLSRERRASAVVMDVASGDILALASVPSFNSNDVADPASIASWRRLSEAEDQPLFNRALSGLYPPGSTFKLVTALAALGAGAIDPNERISCPGSFTIGDKTYRCWKRSGHGDADLARALKMSCDVYFYEVARRIGMAPIAAMARRLGFGEVQVEGASFEKGGVVPEADWKRWNRHGGWATGDTVISSVGQGFVLATPVQLALMTARIATGRMVRARLSATGNLAPRSEFEALDVPPSHLEDVRSAMVAVVNEQGGTGLPARPSSDVVLAGKTGTSQVRRVGADADLSDEELAWEARDHALFVGYYPAGAPRFAISVVVEHGGAGGATAGPIVRDIVEMLIEDDPLRRPPDRQAAMHCGHSSCGAKS